MSNIKTTQISIKEFQALKGYWVLYWIGRVTRSSDSGEFYVELCFVKLANGLSDYPHFTILSGTYSNTERINISIAFSPNLIIGTIIKDGAFYKPSSTLNEKISIRIKNPTALKSSRLKEITLGAPIPNFPTVHKYYNHFIPIRNGVDASIPEKIDLILLPSFEIARRYFLKSDALSKKVFAGEVGDREIYYDEHPDGQTILPESNSQTTYVLITKDMYDEDASHIARIKHNSLAQKAAMHVFSSIYGETEPKKKTVDCFFPFEEESKLDFIGKRFEHVDKNVFVVFQIKKCSAKFFPGELEYDRINDGRSGDTSDAKEQRGPRIVRNNNTKETADAELTGIVKPNFQSPKEMFAFDPEDEYDNAPVKRKRLKEKQQTYNPEAPTVNNDNIDSYSTNPTTSGDRNTSKAGIETENTEDAFEIFRQALNILKDSGYHFHQLHPSNGGHFFTFPHNNLDENSKKWCYLRKNNSDNQPNPRACMIVEFQHSGLYHYILEIQPKYPTESFYTFLLNDELGSKMRESEILTILNEIALYQGKIKGKHFKMLSRINCKRIEHTTIMVGTQKIKNPEYLMNALKRIL